MTEVPTPKKLTLYVAGQTPKSLAAIANLLALAAITPRQCRELIAGMAKLPNKRLAMRRLLGVGDAVSLA